MTSDGLIRFIGASSTVEADMIKEYLESHGVYAFIQSSNHAALLGSIVQAIRPTVMIRKADVEKATELMSTFDRGAIEEIGDAWKHADNPEISGRWKHDDIADEASDDEIAPAIARNRDD